MTTLGSRSLNTGQGGPPRTAQGISEWRARLRPSRELVTSIAEGRRLRPSLALRIRDPSNAARRRHALHSNPAPRRLTLHSNTPALTNKTTELPKICFFFCLRHMPRCLPPFFRLLDETRFPAAPRGTFVLAAGPAGRAKRAGSLRRPARIRFSLPGAQGREPRLHAASEPRHSDILFPATRG